MLNGAAKPEGVLLVEDDPFTRGMVATAISSLGWHPVKSAASAAEAMWVVSHGEPKVAVVDLDLGEGPTGLDVAHGLRRLFPRLGLVIMSTYAEPRLMGLNLPAMPEDTVYLVKKTVTANEVLGRALQLAFERHGARRAKAGQGSDESWEGLSDLQVEIMRLIATGFSNSEIARLRFMSVSGVEKSIARIIRHLGIPGGKESSQRVLVAQAYFKLTGAVSARRA